MVMTGRRLGRSSCLLLFGFVCRNHGVGDALLLLEGGELRHCFFHDDLVLGGVLAAAALELFQLVVVLPQTNAQHRFLGRGLRS
eukprot:15430349-Alexandrium_andersonii.AAC.1